MSPRDTTSSQARAAVGPWYTVSEDTRLRREKTLMSWSWMNCPRKGKLRGVQKTVSLFFVCRNFRPRSCTAQRPTIMQTYESQGHPRNVGRTHLWREEGRIRAERDKAIQSSGACILHDCFT